MWRPPAQFVISADDRCYSIRFLLNKVAVLSRLLLWPEVPRKLSNPLYGYRPITQHAIHAIAGLFDNACSSARQCEHFGRG